MTFGRLPTSAGSLSLLSQMASEKRPGTLWPGIQYGLTAALRGIDYSATMRASSEDAYSLPDLGVSYLQRLNAGSPVMMGGEMWFSPTTFRAVRRSPGPMQESPLNWAVGAVYDSGLSKASVREEGAASEAGGASSAQLSSAAAVGPSVVSYHCHHAPLFSLFSLFSPHLLPPSAHAHTHSTEFRRGSTFPTPG